MCLLLLMIHYYPFIIVLIMNGGEKMGEIKKLATQAKIINSGLFVVTLLVFVSMHITNYTMSFYLQDILLDVYMLLSGLFLAASIYTFLKMKKVDLKGGELMLVASAVSVAFSLTGMMLGIVIFILCGYSIRQINKSVEEHKVASLPKASVNSFSSEENFN